MVYTYHLQPRMISSSMKNWISVMQYYVSENILFYINKIVHPLPWIKNQMGN